MALVVSRQDLRAIGSMLMHLDAAMLLLGLLLTLAMIGVRVARYHLLLRCQGLEIALGASVSIFFKSSFWGLVSPARMGEVIRVTYLKGHGVSFLQGINSVLMDRLLDLAALAVVTLLSTVFLATEDDHGLITLTVASCLLGLGGWGLLELGRPWLKKFLGGRSIMGVSAGLLLDNLFNTRHKLALLAMSVGQWLVFLLGMLAMTSGLNLKVSISMTCFATMTSQLVGMLPVSVAGIGTRDVWLEMLFAQQGLPTEWAVLFSSLILVNYLFYFAVSALWLFLPSGEPHGLPRREQTP
ncbi:lysylphosphatidylglycerol synthase transmembrane domain-containing protein [Fundidesulfovibrio magnetotacticus]|nr:lysylphosphatidylglycerol synthase transmembrane domain-containing protein [Fundidesulfovibrio magnetotacticus]